MDRTIPGRILAKRRDFLKTGLLLGAGLPFYRQFFGESVAHGDPGALKLIVFCSPDGHPFAGKFGKGGLPKTWDTVSPAPFSLAGSLLAPLEPNKSNITLLDKFRLHTGGGHGSTGVHVLRGPKVGTDGPSLDEIVASRQSFKEKALRLGVLSGGTPVSYSASGQGYGHQSNPLRAYRDFIKKHIPSVADGAGAGQAPEAGPPPREGGFALLKSQTDELRKLLATTESKLLDDHVARLDELSRNVAKMAVVSRVGGDLSAFRCGPEKAIWQDCDPMKNNDDFFNGGIGNEGAEGLKYIDRMMDLQQDLLINALAANVTGVGVLRFGQDTCGLPINKFIPDADDMTWHSASHYLDPRSRNWTLCWGWLALKFNRLVDGLAAVKDANGVPLLQNTIVVWVTDLGESEYHSDLHGVVIAGGGGGALKGGRVISGLEGDAPSRKLYTAFNSINKILGGTDDALGEGSARELTQ